jgi:hypothetical protein
MKLAIVIVALTTSVASAQPKFGKVIRDGISVSLPAHWIVAVDAKAGEVVARQDPKRKDAAMLSVAVKLAQPGMRDEAVLQALLGVAKDVKPLGREALPGGHGQAVVAQGTVDGIAVKLGAIAIVDGQRMWAGLLVAVPAEFDAFGGVRALLASLQSLKPADKLTLDIEAMGRRAKRADQPDLDPDRPAVSAEVLRKQPWMHSTASSMFSETHRSGNTAYGYTNGGGNSESYVFAANNTYRLQTLNTVQLNGCNSGGVGVEIGAYQFDGKVLVLTPKQATYTASICGKPSRTEPTKITPPRRYDVGLSPDGWLVFVGTGCTEFPEGGCSDHVRFEMTGPPPAHN